MVHVDEACRRYERCDERAVRFREAHAAVSAVDNIAPGTREIGSQSLGHIRRGGSGRHNGLRMIALARARVARRRSVTRCRL
jgi:hypothetical protein